MKKTSIAVSAVCAMAISSGSLRAQDSESGYDASTYTTCAACHLPDGVGVPGAFPPVRNRAAAMAQLDGGRDYLIAVASYGLMGNMTVDAVQYFGVMPGNSAAMSPEDIAAVLNYIVFELNDAETEAMDAFSAEEVERAQSEVRAKSPAAAGEVRKELMTRHGDGWP